MTESTPAAGQRRPGDTRGRGPGRARSLPGVLGLTTLGAVLPGSAFWVLRRRVLGANVFAAFVLGLAGVTYVLVAQRRMLLRLLVQSEWLAAVIVALAVGFLAWAAVVVASDLLARPRDLGSRGRLGASAFTALLCLLLAAPFGVGMRYAAVQRDFIQDVFAPSTDSSSATRPTLVTEDDPWQGRDRVNVLLLGGDAGPDRFGSRTDSIILASIDVDSGDTVLFGLPRNLEDVPFPEGSKLDELYPNGFSGRGDPLKWMINAIYQRVPELHPAVLGGSDNEGADALKLGVSGALGIPVDYYAMVSMPGFVELIDAMGGVTVNINQPIPIGGAEGLREPEGYLDPGPDQKLDGFEAMWFARGRYGLDDYDRMRRQRCLMDAVIERADPITMLTRYEQILDAGRDILRTDIPAEVLPAFVDLAFTVKDGRLRSVVFERSRDFAPESPDYGWVRDVVARATGETEPAGDGEKSADKSGGGDKGRPTIESAEASCTYRPVA